MNRYRRAAEFADEIEKHLRDLGVWRDAPLPDSAYDGQQAFLADTMTFYQWLQFVLLDRIRGIVAERGSFPARSMVGAYAVRELDGVGEASDLISSLCEFDEFIERGESRDADEPAPVQAPPPSSALPAPSKEPEPSESPAEVVERYWRTRDAALLHSQPYGAPTYDASTAERVFQTATAFVTLVGEQQATEGGWMLDAVVEAERGRWLVRTVVRKDGGQWRVDLACSLERTAKLFLLCHNIHPPYTDKSDARGRAMEFWNHVMNHDDRRAREMMAVPRFGEGNVDEFCWYINHEETGDSGVVRVLLNTHDECRELETRMVKVNGEWCVATWASTTSTSESRSPSPYSPDPESPSSPDRPGN